MLLLLEGLGLYRYKPPEEAASCESVQRLRSPAAVSCRYGMLGGRESLGELAQDFYKMTAAMQMR